MPLLAEPAIVGLLLAFTGVLGLLVGSFLNVVIARVPVGASVVHPPSRCPRCETPISPRDNVPVLSWLVLRGRCRACRTPISARYPAVELVTAIVWLVLALRIGLDWELPAYLYGGSIGVALALIDIDVKRLPDAIVLPSYVVVTALLLLPAVADSRWSDFLRALLGMAALYAFYFVLALVYPGGMGFGDVKLAGVLGLYMAWLGWGAWAVGAFAGFLLGGLVGVLLLATGRAGRKSAVPFGPFMLVGALIAILAGPDLARTYVDLTLG